MKKSNISHFKKNSILKIINNSVIKLPTPNNISIWWNLGSLLGLSLMFQIVTGLFLSMHYCPEASMAFKSIVHIVQDVENGWIIRLMHMNGASFFFFCMYIHIGRGMYYGSYMNMKTWYIGVIIFLMSMGTAFLGYVLPWGQMSFWGATVITNLISTIPYIGNDMVQWIWGGFSVSNPTLNRFYTFHFLLPFIIMILVVIHLLFIHEMGSSNPLGINSNLMKIPFHNYFTLKDIFGFFIMFMLLIFITLHNPFILNDPENFILSNPMITPIHIQPEWYFLFAYTILRSIPNKLGGVIALLSSILIMFIMPLINLSKTQSIKFFPLNKILFWLFINNVFILTWLGSMPVESPFIEISQIFTLSYFLFYFLNPLMFKIWEMINNY